MSKFNFNYVLILIIVVLCYLLWIQRPITNSNIITITDTIYGDSVITIDTIDLESKPVIIRTPPDTFFKNVDSAAILARCMEIAMNYYEERFYSDTLKNDSSAFIALEYKLWKNEIYDKVLFFKNNRATIINNSFVPEQKNRLYIGAFAGFNSLGPSAMFENKNRTAYSMSYDIANKRGYITAYFKLYERNTDKK